MKRMHYTVIIILTIAVGFLARAVQGGVPVKFTVETSRADIQEIPCYHGETLDFEVTMKNYGQNLYLPTNEEAKIFWQTNGMSAFYWNTNNVTIVSNKYYATFTPDMDPGTTTAFGFIGTPKEIYRASFVLRFKNSPGVEPKIMEWPYREFDFEKIEVKNPPYYTKEETDEVLNEKLSELMTEKRVMAWEWGHDYYTGLPQKQFTTITNWEEWIGEPLSNEDFNFGYREIATENEAPRLSYATAYNLWTTAYKFKPAFTSTVEKAAWLGGTTITWYGDFKLDWDNIVNKPNNLEGAFPEESGEWVSNEVVRVSSEVEVVSNKAWSVAEEVESVSNRAEQAVSSVENVVGYLNAEDARFVSTNYNSTTKIPTAYVQVLQSNEWLTVWQETRRWDAFTGTNFDWSAWTSFAAFETNMAAQIEMRSPREYAFYDGVTGEVAPDGFFWIAQPRVAVCAGAAYQRYVDGDAEVWVLESNGLVTDINGASNGVFRITDSDGTAQFEIVKADKRTLMASPYAMTSEVEAGVTHYFTTYAITNATSAPIAQISVEGPASGFYDETDADCPANVAWTAGDNSYTLEWWPKTTQAKMFVKASYELGGSSYTRLKTALKIAGIEGNVYDFATMKGMYEAVRDVVTALGGSVTNYPSFAD